MKCWVVLYFHRHGTDAWPVFQTNRPTEKKVIEKLKEEWEGDTRDDEWIEIRGPWKIPAQKATPSPDGGKSAERLKHLMKEAGP